jgi:hypothetical protein
VSALGVFLHSGSGALPSRRHASADFIEQTYVGRGGWTVPPTSRKRLLLARSSGLALMAVAVASTAKRRRAAFDIVERRKSNMSLWLIIVSLLLVKYLDRGCVCVEECL